MEPSTVADLLQAFSIVLLLLAALGLFQYGIINMNTGLQWMPFVVGPFEAGIFVLSISVPILSRDFILAGTELLLFVLLTAIAYALTYANSTVFDYEMVLLLLSITSLITLYLNNTVGSKTMSEIALLIHLALILVPATLFVLLAFKNGSTYPYIVNVVGALSLLASLLLLIPPLSQSKTQAVVLTIIAMSFFAAYILGGGVVGPDVTAWMFRAPVLISYLTLLSHASRSGWE